MNCKETSDEPWQTDDVENEEVEEEEEDEVDEKDGEESWCCLSIVFVLPSSIILALYLVWYSYDWGTNWLEKDSRIPIKDPITFDPNRFVFSDHYMVMITAIATYNLGIILLFVHKCCQSRLAYGWGHDLLLLAGFIFLFGFYIARKAMDNYKGHKHHESFHGKMGYGIMPLVCVQIVDFFTRSIVGYSIWFRAIEVLRKKLRHTIIVLAAINGCLGMYLLAFSNDGNWGNDLYKENEKAHNIQRMAFFFTLFSQTCSWCS